MTRAEIKALPGLRQMMSSTPAGFCPFCDDRLATKAPGEGGRKPHTCGDVVCLVAWERCYRRDYRRDGRERL